MKKVELKTQIEDLISNQVDEVTLTKTLELIDQLGRKSATVTGLPKELEIEGVTYRYCNRHGQYEPVEWFLIEKDGKYKPECAAAYYKWQAYGKDINKAIKDGDATKLGELTLLRKKGGYDLKADAKEFADKLAEEGITINPKDAKTKEEVEAIVK